MLVCVIFLFIVYIVNYIIIAIFCTLKKKRNNSQLEEGVIDNPISNNNGVNNTETNGLKKSIVQAIVKFMSGWMRYRIIRLGKFPCHAYRNFILKNVYKMNIGKNVVIYGGFEIRDPWNISIGEGSIIGDNAILDGRNGIVVGKDVNFSTGVWLWTEQHDFNDTYFLSNKKGGPIKIGNRAWISSRVSILPDITIGEGAVVAAGAVVTKNCEQFAVYGGVPAKKISNRNRNLKYKFNGNHLPFY